MDHRACYHIRYAEFRDMLEETGMHASFPFSLWGQPEQMFIDAVFVVMNIPERSNLIYRRFLRILHTGVNFLRNVPENAASTDEELFTRVVRGMFVGGYRVHYQGNVIYFSRFDNPDPRFRFG